MNWSEKAVVGPPVCGVIVTRCEAVAGEVLAGLELELEVLEEPHAASTLAPATAITAPSAPRVSARSANAIFREACERLLGVCRDRLTVGEEQEVEVELEQALVSRGQRDLCLVGVVHESV